MDSGEPEHSIERSGRFRYQQKQVLQPRKQQWMGSAAVPREEGGFTFAFWFMEKGLCILPALIILNRNNSLKRKGTNTKPVFLSERGQKDYLLG